MSQVCKTCDQEVDSYGSCDNCDYPPEDYVRPGGTTLMYVNAYQVTRHYGGREEGGWWFNHSEPLASIPVHATSHEHHDSSCWTCHRAQEGAKDDDGNLIKACKWGYHLVPDEKQVDQFKTHLQSIFDEVEEGDIYSVLGGAELCICVEEHPGEATPRPHYE